MSWSGEGFNTGFQEFLKIFDRMKEKPAKTYY